MKTKSVITALVLSFLSTIGSFAQSDSDDYVFNEGKIFVSGQFSGLNLNYNQFEELKLDVGLRGGYFVYNDLMALVNFQFATKKNNMGSDPTEFVLGCGARYYIEQNGLYFGATVNWCNLKDVYNDVRPEVHLGYAYFLSRTVTIEPEVYYCQSFVNHSKYSGFGLRLGLSFYLE